jgi:branched-chain amino acid transport system ATP-binding protein
MNPLLEATNLSKTFAGMRAVNDVHIAFYPDRVTGIIGPNGAGKTTLVHLLTGHVQPDAGQILFEGQDITRLSADQRVNAHVCRTFQVVDIFPRLTVFENVQIARITREAKNLRWFGGAAREARDAVEAALEEVGMWGFRNRRAEQLSHGQQRRVDLAVTLATEPRLCFLDEPTSGVSPKERDQMLELIGRLAAARRTTFVLIEHDMEVIFNLCAHVVCMHRGAVLAEGTPDDIRANKEIKEIYLGEAV